MTSPLRVVIVDDEKLARDRVRRFLSSDAGVEIIGECDGGAAAIKAIAQLIPDVVFLDIQMPEVNGFDVVASLHASKLHTPRIVFVTAYDEHAVRAFEVNALDYIVKPFSSARVRAAIGRARDYLSRDSGDYDRRLEALLSQIAPGSGSRWEERIAIRSRDRIVFVRTSDIDWIETAGNYIRVHTGDKAHLVRDSLTALAARLDPSRFIRIHRRILVNADHVQELQPWFSGDWIVIMTTGTKLRLSRNFRELIERASDKRLRSGTE
jgi:two-component system LytT family response regulator